MSEILWDFSGQPNLQFSLWQSKRAFCLPRTNCGGLRFNAEKLAARDARRPAFSREAAASVSRGTHRPSRPRNDPPPHQRCKRPGIQRRGRGLSHANSNLTTYETSSREFCVRLTPADPFGISIVQQFLPQPSHSSFLLSTDRHLYPSAMIIARFRRASLAC